MEKLRELLERWAELEPDEFNEDDLETISDPESLARNDIQAKVQNAVQAVIISKGWTLSLEWNGEWEAWIKDKWTYSDLDNPAIALLGAYIAALEGSKL